MQGETGTLVALDNIDEMAMAIIRYVADPDLRIAQGNAAREFIEEQFSLDRMVDQYLEVYDRLVGPSESAAQSTAT